MDLKHGKAQALQVNPLAPVAVLRVGLLLAGLGTLRNVLTQSGYVGEPYLGVTALSLFVDLMTGIGLIVCRGVVSRLLSCRCGTSESKETCSGWESLALFLFGIDLILIAVPNLLGLVVRQLFPIPADGPRSSLMALAAMVLMGLLLVRVSRQRRPLGWALAGSATARVGSAAASMVSLVAACTMAFGIALLLGKLVRDYFVGWYSRDELYDPSGQGFASLILVVSAVILFLLRRWLVRVVFRADRDAELAVCDPVIAIRVVLIGLAFWAGISALSTLARILGSHEGMQFWSQSFMQTVAEGLVQLLLCMLVLRRYDRLALWFGGAAPKVDSGPTVEEGDSRVTLDRALSCALGGLALWWICDSLRSLASLAAHHPFSGDGAGGVAGLVMGVALVVLRKSISRLVLLGLGHRRGPFDRSDYLALTSASIGVLLLGGAGAFALSLWIYMFYGADITSLLEFFAPGIVVMQLLALGLLIGCRWTPLIVRWEPVRPGPGDWNTDAADLVESLDQEESDP